MAYMLGTYLILLTILSFSAALVSANSHFKVMEQLPCLIFTGR